MPDNKEIKLKNLEVRGRELEYSDDKLESVDKQPLANIEKEKSTDINFEEGVGEQELDENAKKFTGLTAISNAKHNKIERKKRIEKVLEKNMGGRLFKYAAT